MGQPALEAVEGILRMPEVKWSFVRSLLMLLARAGSEIQLPVVQGYLSHPHPEVRVAAMDSYLALAGPLAEPLIEERLDDEKEDVRVRALALLARLGCRSTRLLQFIVDLLDKRKKGRPDASEAMQIRACHALVRIGDINLNDEGETVETFLLYVVREEPLGVFGIGRSKLATKCSRIRSEVLATLAEIGGEATRRAMMDMSRGDTAGRKLQMDVFEKPEDNPIDLAAVARKQLKRLTDRLDEGASASSPSAPEAEAVEGAPPAEEPPAEEPPAEEADAG